MREDSHSHVVPFGKVTKKEKALSLVFFGHGANLTGAERSLLSLVEDLVVHRGAICTVILPQHGPLEPLLRNSGATVAVMPFSWWCGPDGTTQEALTSALSADVRAFFCDVLPFVKSVGPDVIVTQSMVIPWGAAAAAALGKPHIWSVCEYGELDHGLHFVEPVAKITAEIETSSDFIFFAVDDIRKALFSDLSQDRCDVLYRHIEADQFGESAASESGPIRRLGVVGLFGTVVPSKGQADAIEAVAELNARGMPVELVLAGAGQPDYVKKLKQRVQDLGIGELVRFTGFLENPYPVMRACDIVLVCSRREAFGRTAAEAMLMAKPLIYAASGGVAEYVEDGKTGLSYPPGEFKALADRIETLLGDSSLAARLGEAAEIFARATFTRENYGGKFHKKALTLRDAPSRHSNFPKALLPAIQRAAEIQGREIAIAIAEKASLESLLANRVAEVIEAERRIAGYAATLDERNAQLIEAERRIAGYAATSDERNAQLIEAQRRIAALEKSVVERDQELGLYARRIAAMKSSLSWRLTSPFREMYRPFRGLRTSPWEGKLSAALRHPANSRKRKKYRLVHMPEHAVVESPNPGRRTHLAQKLRAIARYPFSRRLRRDYRKQLHGFVSPALASQASAPSLAALPANCPDASLFRRYVRNAAGGSNPGDFVPLSNEHTSAAQCDVKLVAYYLPQFHPIPENDEWWGKGFTEWRNVTRTFPVFEEHYQPRIPGELGHYDLRLIDTMRRQVELAKQYGISAFCFHFYWFGGQRLLELPIEGFLNNTDLDLQFSLCWANENWSRRWDGGNNELLIAQKHSPEDDIAFIRYLDRYFRDRRYMKVDGKPVLTIYRPAIIPHIKETIARWRLEAREMGYPDLYLIATNSFAFKDYAEYGFDALSEFPPHSIQARQIQDELELASMRKSGPIYSFASLVDIELAKPAPLGTVHPGVMPSWDNSARRPYDGHIFHGSTPALFARWLKNCFERACKNRRGEQFVFLNAWNEWAEGAYLEPDQRYGYAYLAACAAVVGDNSRSLIAPSLPNVSAIIPNYNHGRFLKERIDSILEQRLPVTELIILDDASTDDSRDIIASLTADISVPVKTVLNDTNSGSIFSQWARGISVAEGDLVWICESDDTCDRGFLEALVPYFEDQSVMLAFGRIDFIEEDGRLRPGMDDYMESAGPGYWQAPRVESAYAWFQGPFGVRNVIPNVGGCIFRRQQMRPDLLAELTSYKTCGDWHLYSRIAHGGRIAYDPAAQAYFRQHRTNSSVANFQTESFFEEHIRIAQALRRHYGSGFETMRKMLGHVRKHHRSIFGQAAANEFAVRHSLENILVQERTVTHILIAMYGFQTGGGEVFPIHLANELAKRGYDVSLLIAESDRVNNRIRRMLDPAIPIFTKSFVEKVGVKRFFDDFGVDLIHTHNITFDLWLHSQCDSLRTSYVVTHHGSYEAVGPSANVTKWLLENVDHWVYIAEKNLSFMQGFARNDSAMTKLPNALPQMQGEFPLSRHDLGIEPSAFVFGLASRAIRQKGWDIAIRALRKLRNQATKPVYLLLSGDGEDLDVLKAAHRNEPGVRFLGYQDKIQAFYRLCDCCLLPTRYVGESYPLTIIEAILAGIPAIATDVGEIRSMLRIDREPMGIVLLRDEDDAVFGQSVEQAMQRMLDDGVYESLRASVLKNRDGFSMDKLVDDYMAIYQRVLSGAGRAQVA